MNVSELPPAPDPAPDICPPALKRRCDPEESRVPSKERERGKEFRRNRASRKAFWLPKLLLMLAQLINYLVSPSYGTSFH